MVLIGEATLGICLRQFLFFELRWQGKRIPLGISGSTYSNNLPHNPCEYKDAEDMVRVRFC